MTLCDSLRVSLETFSSLVLLVFLFSLCFSSCLYCTHICTDVQVSYPHLENRLYVVSEWGILCMICRIVSIQLNLLIATSCSEVRQAIQCISRLTTLRGGFSFLLWQVQSSKQTTLKSQTRMDKSADSEVNIHMPSYPCLVATLKN